MHFTRLDVVSSSIMRGRDNGIPSYNDMRKSFNLERREWHTINKNLDPGFVRNLSALYDNDIDKLDAYVGGMLETNGNGPGELFTEITLDQFIRLRDSDRFWFENTNNGLVRRSIKFALIHTYVSAAQAQKC
jgi:dual oxidase